VSIGAEIKAGPLQKMNAVLTSNWGDLSSRLEFEQIKYNTATELREDLADILFDLLSAKEGNGAAKNSQKLTWQPIYRTLTRPTKMARKNRPGQRHIEKRAR
jgi:hypothetical protein